jgi:hypothetical protein
VSAPDRPLRAALLERGIVTPHDRGVELWRMLYEVHRIATEISLEINRTAEEARALRDMRSR